MAQLKDSIVTGSLRVTDKIYASTLNGLVLTSAATGFTIAGGTTSKTLTVAGTATINTPTQWGIVYGGASGAYTSTAAGTSGQYLKSNGAAAPTWATFSPSTIGLEYYNFNITWGSTSIANIGSVNQFATTDTLVIGPGATTDSTVHQAIIKAQFEFAINSSTGYLEAIAMGTAPAENTVIPFVVIQFKA